MSHLRTIETSLAHLPDKPLITSRNRFWGEALTVDLHRSQRNFEQDAPPLDHHFVACILQGSGRMLQERGGRQYSSILRGDSALIMPAGEQARWRGEHPKNLRFRIPVDRLVHTWQELGTHGSREVELHSIFSARDVVLQHLASIFVHECYQPDHPAQRLLLEAASCAVTAHLVRTYCTFGGKPIPKPIRLSFRALQTITSYLEENLAKPISLDDLAGLAGVSRFHFCRIFRESTGMTPMRFVDRMRIHRAQDMIRSGRRGMRQIAMRVGFSDPSHFSRRFAVYAKCTPRDFAHEHAASPSELCDDEL